MLNTTHKQIHNESKKYVYAIFFSIAFILTVCVTPTKADSVDNVFSSIRILATIPDLEDRARSRGTATNEHFQEIAARYRAALEIGSDYWSLSLRHELGSEFTTEWRDAVRALEDIVEYYNDLEQISPAQRMSPQRIRGMMHSMQRLENFRLFYEGWRIQ